MTQWIAAQVNNPEDPGEAHVIVSAIMPDGHEVKITIHQSKAYANTLNVEIDGDFVSRNRNLRIHLNDNLIVDTHERHRLGIPDTREPDLPPPATFDAGRVQDGQHRVPDLLQNLQPGDLDLLSGFGRGPRIWDAMELQPRLSRLMDAGLLRNVHPDGHRHELTDLGRSIVVELNRAHGGPH
jgi:hypothetical protein